MTREEKIELIERERDGWQDDADDHKRRGCVAHYEHEQAMADVLTEAVAAVRGPQPDPSTGLLPCGCGGKPEYIHSHPNINKGTYGVRCFDCDAMIGLYADNYCLVGDYAHKNDAKNAWNTSRGYTAPSRPGAIGPDSIRPENRAENETKEVQT